ncbi:MAG: type II toxin-antitoxin system TacA family antitoxin [Bauldia sp.]
MSKVTSAIRSTRIEARIAPDALAIVRRAAEIQGRSLSDFVVAAAQREAERTVEAAQIIRLSIADQEALARAILEPPAPNAALRRAMHAHERLVVESK